MLGIYPLVMADIAIEHGHRNSEFSHEQWWFSIVTLVYQRVNTNNNSLAPNMATHRKMSSIADAVKLRPFGEDSLYETIFPVTPKGAVVISNPENANPIPIVSPYLLLVVESHSIAIIIPYPLLKSVFPIKTIWKYMNHH